MDGLTRRFGDIILGDPFRGHVHIAVTVDLAAVFKMLGKLFGANAKKGTTCAQKMTTNMAVTPLRYER